MCIFLARDQGSKRKEILVIELAGLKATLIVDGLIGQLLYGPILTVMGEGSDPISASCTFRREGRILLKNSS